MAASVTIPFPPDLFEALAVRVAELLAERPPAQRYLDSEAAAHYLGLSPKTLRTKRGATRAPLPTTAGSYIDRLALDAYLASHATHGQAPGRSPMPLTATARGRLAPFVGRLNKRVFVLARTRAGA